ncbi:MAG: type II toxin-antitoxin system VapC family toxin [Deltaproteobacteria bacterium]|nr:type II toxin-antitoxin system VapC family toxin [Deltaproteobacteria bacterium]
MTLLDTHVWLWWVNQDRQRLRSSWLPHLSGPGPLFVSAISCFEAAWLINSKRVVIGRASNEWFELALAGSGISVAPVTESIARLSADLPHHHKDPQDRMIIATAIINDAKILSADERFAAYKELEGRLVP